MITVKIWSCCNCKNFLFNGDDEANLKIEANGDTYSFYYSFKKRKWNLLKTNVDGKFLSTKIAGGFVGCIYALYTTSLDTERNAEAFFDSFECKGNDIIFN